MGYAVTEFFIWCVSHAVGLMQITSFYLLSIVVDRHSCVVTSCCSCIKFIIYLNKINSFYTLVVFSVLQPLCLPVPKTGKPPLRLEKYWFPVFLRKMSRNDSAPSIIPRFLEALVVIIFIINRIAEIVVSGGFFVAQITEIISVAICTFITK